MHHPTDRIAHTTAFVTPVVEHWLERENAQWVHHEGSIRRLIAPWVNALTTELHLAPCPKGVQFYSRTIIARFTTFHDYWFDEHTFQVKEHRKKMHADKFITDGYSCNSSVSIHLVEGRKEKFYLTMHSTHFIYGLYGVGHMVKDHSDSERENMGYSFRLAARFLLYASSHRQENTFHSLLHQSWSTGWNKK